MASTVWKGQLTFGLVSFTVRLVRAARKDRIPLRYVRTTGLCDGEDEDATATAPATPSRETAEVEEEEERGDGRPGMDGTIVAPVRQAYLSDPDDNPVAPRLLQRGYEVAPGQFAVVHSDELRRLRQRTSSSMEILRSVRMAEIDPVFLETSYYVLPGNGADHSYGLFYRALEESGYAALADVAMHGRQHVVVIRAGAKGLIAHTMYYVNEVRAADEHAAQARDVPVKEIDLARRFIEAIAAPFNPGEFTDRYREQLESLIASKQSVPSRAATETAQRAVGNVVDIMDALRKSLEKVEAAKTARKPVTPAAAPAKRRQRRA